jgi:hypothetical protein
MPIEKLESALRVNAIRESATTVVRQQLEAALGSGLVEPVNAVDLLAAYLGSNSHVMQTLIELGASRQQFESVQAAFSVATIVGLSAGSHDPEHLSKLQKIVGGKRTELARAIKAASQVDRPTIDQIVIQEMQEAERRPGSPGKIKIAERALPIVNDRLAERAKQLGLKAPRYKDADTLRRVYSEALKRTAK